METHNKQFANYLGALIIAVIFFGCSNGATKTVDEFTGIWSIEENCNGLMDEYELEISKISDTEINIYNLWNVREDIKGVLVGNSIEIPVQNLIEATYEGSIFKVGNALNLNFMIDGKSCTAAGNM